MKKLLTALTLALAILLAGAPAALARGLTEDKVVVGDNFTLQAGETINGNLIVLGGNVTVEDGARITGNVVVFGGNVELAGTVGGDMVTFGGNADLRSTAVVEGQLVTSGGSISREEGSQVKGGETQSPPFTRPVIVPRLPAPLSPLSPILDLILNLIGSGATAVLLAALALVVGLFLPDQTRRVSAAMMSYPVASGGLGLLTLIAGPVLIVLMAITICLIPFSLIAAIVYSIALVFGWIGVGALIGERLAAGLRWQNVGAAVSAAMGTFLITFLAQLLNVVSHFSEVLWLVSLPLACLAFIVPLVLVSVGLGAVTLTRFGTRPYLAGTPAAPATPPAAPPPPPAELPPTPPPADAPTQAN